MNGVGGQHSILGAGDVVVVDGEDEARVGSEVGIIGKIEVGCLTNRLVLAGSRAIFDVAGGIARADRLVAGERSQS